mmetsp:Transcript_53325/g.83027  ORF Transcript_53325/g.83027 Transcript_53325/m.83027 type:complete len:1630 (-) Transcript_53325:130-5019(-)
MSSKTNGDHGDLACFEEDATFIDVNDIMDALEPVCKEVPNEELPSGSKGPIENNVFDPFDSANAEEGSPSVQSEVCKTAGTPQELLQSVGIPRTPQELLEEPRSRRRYHKKTTETLQPVTRDATNGTDKESKSHDSGETVTLELEVKSPMTEEQTQETVCEFEACCSAALQKGLGTRGKLAALPLVQAARLADAVRETTVNYWTDISKCVGGRSVPRVLPAVVPACLIKLCAGLGSTFTALAKVQVPLEDTDSEKIAFENIECGLRLAALYFDIVATSCQQLQAHAQGDAESESLEDVVLHFVSHVMRVLYSAKGSPLSSCAVRLADAVAHVWQAAHRAIAAERYTLSPLSRRVIPLAARCLLSLPVASTSADTTSPMVAVGKSSADILVAAAGQGDRSLHDLAIEELAGGSSLVTSHRPNGNAKSNHVAASDTADKSITLTKGRGRNKRRQQGGPGPYTAALFRAVSAQCFPGHTDTAEIASDASEVYKKAESQAGELITGILRRNLLASSDRESEGWLRLEALTKEMLDSCGDPMYPSAPLVVLCLARGLARIAGASRNVEMSWTQREFAVRLLGMISGSLCRECVCLDKTSTKDSDLAEVQSWAKSCQKSGAERFENVQEFRNHLIQFLELRRTTPALIPQTAIENLHLKPNGTKPRDIALTEAVLPFDHPIYSSAFILCSMAAPNLSRTALKNASLKKKRKCDRNRENMTSNVVPDAVPEHSVDETGATTDCTDWALAEWSRCTNIREPPSMSRKADKNRDAIQSSVVRLYKRSLYQDLGTLSRARLLCLETLLTQLKASPLVFVRRQSMTSLAGACCSDMQLANSRCAGEAVSHGLKDDSSLVRSATIDFIGRLVSGRAEGMEPKYACELRAAARGCLSDVASGVRRAAFRVVCEALCREDPGLMSSASELLRRIRYETQQVRDPVLSALQSVILAPPLPEGAVEQLSTLVADSEIAGTGIRDIFIMHRTVAGAATCSSSLAGVADRAFEEIGKLETAEDGIYIASVLEQIGLEEPKAFFPHIQTLQSWLSVSGDSSLGRSTRAQQACRILSDILPCWVTQAEDSEREQFGRKLEKSLAPLLKSSRNSVIRAAMECFCVIALHVTGDYKKVLAYVCQSMQHIQEVVEQGSSLDGKKQQLLRQNAWMLSTAHEFLDVDSLSLLVKSTEPELASAHGSVGLLSRLLSALCMKGPLGLRTSLVPCLGFLSRRYTSLMQSQLGPKDVFQFGLHNDVSMQTCTIEALAELLVFYQKAAEAGAPPGGIKDEAVLKCLAKPKVSEAVQRLSELQPTILTVLLKPQDPLVAEHALSVVRSFSHLGVLHPAPALSALVAASLVSSPTLAKDTSRLMLKLVESGPQQLLTRLGDGIRQAASILVAGSFEPGVLVSQNWRFSMMAELCSEHYEGKRMREAFIDAFLAEAEHLTTASESSVDRKALQNRMELLVGILLNLPYRNELELAHILRRSSDFMTLHTIPLMLESAVSVHTSQIFVLGSCYASLLLYSVCSHLCTLEEMRRLITEEANGECDRPVSPGFSRRLGAGASSQSLMAELFAAGDSNSALAQVLSNHVPSDSCLLKSKHVEKASGAKAAGKGRKRKLSTSDMVSQKKPCAEMDESFSFALAGAGA